MDSEIFVDLEKIVDPVKTLTFLKNKTKGK